MSYGPTNAARPDQRKSPPSADAETEGQALHTGRTRPCSDGDYAHEVGVIASEHSIDLTFRPESAPCWRPDDSLAKDRYSGPMPTARPSRGHYTLRRSRANGQREDPSPRHRVDSWYPVIPVKVVPSLAAGDTLGTSGDFGH